MDVQLYIYDLSQGLAKQFSQAILGVQIDAVYHTSLVMGGVEYFFGAGVQTSYPGQTHHGAPMEVLPLGATNLPMDIILEYLESLKQVYSAESYDLWLHNCNNFTNDFAMFLVGKGIPPHITGLPKAVLDTPFGQMLRPHLERSLQTVTQAPVPHQRRPPVSSSSLITPSGAKTAVTLGNKVHNVTAPEELERLLESALDRCAVIFFTSSTCAPCKIVYPAYDELAAEAGDKAVLIKVDINQAREIGAKYGINATPTFLTILRGKVEEQWSGADEMGLRGKVRMLLQAAFPPHPHAHLELNHLLRTSLRGVTFTKVPPLDKLTAKMGSFGTEEPVVAITKFLHTRNISEAKEAPLPDMTAFAAFLSRATSELPPDILFTVYDLLRISLVDPRVSGFFAEEHDSGTIRHLIAHVNSLPKESVPYSLRIVALHVCCNLFTSPIYRKFILSSHSFSNLLTTLISTSLLDDAHSNVRVAAASLAFNLTSANHRVRVEEKREALPADDQVELAASLLEAVGAEGESKEAIKGLVLALGFLVYYAPEDGEILDLCKAMDAAGTVRQKEALSGNDPIVVEVGRKLLGQSR